MKTIKVIDLLKILLTQVGDIPKQVYFENYKYEYDSKENDYYCEQLNFFLFMNVLGENLEINLDLPITIIEEDKEIEYKPIQELKNKRFTNNQKQIAGKINEIIKAVNELRKGK